MRKVIWLPAIAIAALTVVGCSETWEGAKEDTRGNVEAVGEGVQDVGKKIEKQAQ